MNDKAPRYEARTALDPPGTWCVWDLQTDTRVPKADKVQIMHFGTQAAAEKAARGMNELFHAIRFHQPQ